MTTTEPIYAYGYSRVSKVGARGDDLISPELQQFEIDRWARQHNVVVLEHIVDLDETGRSFEKRKIKQMVDGIESGKASMVILWKWSRWGRNLLQSRVNIALVERAGGSVRAATEDFDPETTIGKFTRDQMLMIAELQSNQIGDGWKETQAKRRRDGLPHNSRARFGYTYDREQRAYVVDESLRDVIPECYQRYNDGQPMSKIARDLNDRGVPSPNGCLWSTQNLGRALDTGFAAGLIRERESPKINSNRLDSFDVWRPGKHEVLIEMDVWDVYYAKRRAAAAKRGPGPALKHTFTGFLECGECGSHLITQHTGNSTGRTYHSWTCARQIEARRMGQPQHDPVFMSDRLITRAFRDWVSREVADEATDLEKVKNALPDPGVARVDVLRTEVDRIVGHRKRLVSLMVRGAIEDEDYQELKTELDRELAAANGRLLSAQAQTTGPRDADMLRHADAVWDSFNTEERRPLVAALVRSIVIRPASSDQERVMVQAAWE